MPCGLPDAGSLILPPSLVAALRTSAPPRSEVQPESSLTERELEVLRRLSRGEEPRVIAKQLGVSLSTCRGYVSSLLGKLKVHSQLEAVVVASKAGLIRLGE